MAKLAKKDIIIISICIIIVSGILFYAFGLKYVKCNHKITYKNFNIYHQGNIDTNIYSVLDTIERKVEGAEVFCSDDFSEIFVMSEFVSYSMVVPQSWRSFGMYSPITKNIICSKTDSENNVFYIHSNTEIKNKRKFSGVITHELIHYMIYKKYGIKTLFIKKWKEEGYCEYVSQESSFGFEKGIEYFVNDKEEDTDSFMYFQYRLYVKYLIDYKKMTFQQILDGDFDIEELENEIRNKINTGEFLPNL